MTTAKIKDCLRLCSECRQIRFVSQIRSLRQTVHTVFLEVIRSDLCVQTSLTYLWVAVVTTLASVTMYAGDAAFQRGSTRNGDPSSRPPNKRTVVLCVLLHSSMDSAQPL